MNVQEQYAARPQRRPKYGNSVYQRRQKAIALASVTVAEQLSEPNTAAVARLMEIFGEAFVLDMASDARRRFDEAAALGPQAYKAQPKGSDVATYTGERRTAGGVLFYLMREHATALGLDWYGLRIPSAPRDQATEQAVSEQSKTVVKADTSIIPKALERAFQTRC